MAARHDRQYNQGGVQMGGYEAAGGRDGSLLVLLGRNFIFSAASSLPSACTSKKSDRQKSMRGISESRVATCSPTALRGA